jgi:hypothetical protein
MLVARASGDSLTVIVSPFEKEISDPPIFWSWMQQISLGLIYAIRLGLSWSLGWTFKSIIASPPLEHHAPPDMPRHTAAKPYPTGKTLRKRFFAHALGSNSLQRI